jgi:hypothetical protein
MHQLSTLTLEYVRVPVQATENGMLVDISGDSVQMAFPLTGLAPIGVDWKGASWETDPTVTPNVYYARCLVGPGGAVVLAAGMYDVWLKVTDNPEVPIRKAGQVRVL